ncbi:MAG: hypothetical protein RIS52_1731 [Pseudomonadota bacterium]
MRTKSNWIVLALLSSAAVGFSIPVLGQDRPESILPTGFNDPEPAKPKPAPPSEPKGDQPSSPGTDSAPNPSPSTAPRKAHSAAAKSGSGASDLVAAKDAKAADAEELDPDAPLPIIVDIPAQSRRSTAVIGTLNVLGDGDMGLFAFQNFNGVYLSSIMNQIKAPIASRWSSIFLRRALLTRSQTPADIQGADWAASRASLLVRMGESNASRSLVQAVDVDQYTPFLGEVAMEAALASADPAALCGVVDYVKTTDKDLAADEMRVMRWRLAKAMCSGLSGESSVANANLERARNKLGETNIDALLPEKVVGAGANTRRSVKIEWEDVKDLTSWRFGLATATGLSVPERLYKTMGPQVRAWQALAPLLPPGERMAAADTAAEFGVLSSQALVNVYASRYDATDPAERAGKPPQLLREAYAGATPETRIAAMKALWKGTVGGANRFAGLIVTARAAATIPVSNSYAADAPNLVAAMLTAGLDRTAAKWTSVIGGEPGNGAWGLLAVGSPQPMANISSGMIDDFGGTSETNSKMRAQFLFAGLAALGRISEADMEEMAKHFEVPIGRQTKWNKALGLAAEARSPASVAVLAAVGLQATDWSKIPAAHLFHIVRAMRAVGYEAEARMVAAEALMRT